MCVQKSAVSVAEMAKAVGLCRARFYQLLGSAFPYPIYDVRRETVLPARTPGDVPGCPAAELRYRRQAGHVPQAEE